MQQEQDKDTRMCKVDDKWDIYICNYTNVDEMVKDVNAVVPENVRLIVMSGMLKNGQNLSTAFNALFFGGCNFPSVVKMLELHVCAHGQLSMIIHKMGLSDFSSLAGLKISWTLEMADLPVLARFAISHVSLIGLDISDNALFKSHHQNTDDETVNFCCFFRDLNCFSNVQELGLVQCNTATTIIASIREACANKVAGGDRWRIKKFFLESVNINEMPNIVGNQDAKVYRMSSSSSSDDDDEDVIID